jgi:8-oxo-dGTP diphosphatase
VSARAAAANPIHVVAGVLADATGRVLLAQRPAGRDCAGLWEFPGGKLEPGEDAHAALARELREELGIAIAASVPLIRVPWCYPQRRIVLEVRRVAAWRGTPQPHDAQALTWAEPAAIDSMTMPPADRPALAALRLPPLLAISPPLDDAAMLLAWARDVMRRGARLLQLRQPRWTTGRLRAAAAALRGEAHAAGAALLLNGDIEGGLALDLGVQLRAAQLAALHMRPLPTRLWLGASCHDAGELERAAVLGCDFALLSPVAATPTHPQATPLGWPRFAELVSAAALPVYALGGMDAGDLPRARAAGAHGVASIRGFCNQA